MTISDVAKYLGAEIHACEKNLARNVKNACGADLMSDVLAFSKEQALLLTGLINPQVVRTAEMMDIKAIVFVRGKAPTPEILSLAEEKSIVVLSTEHPMFLACGILYENGLGGSGE